MEEDIDANLAKRVFNNAIRNCLIWGLIIALLWGGLTAVASGGWVTFINIAGALLSLWFAYTIYGFFRVVFTVALSWVMTIIVWVAFFEGIRVIIYDLVAG